jgi:hypothetical protein
VGGTVTASLGTIPAGATASVTIVVQAPRESVILTNEASVAGTNCVGGDVSAGVSIAVGDAVLAGIPSLAPKMLAILALLFVWVGLRAARGGA